MSTLTSCWVKTNPRRRTPSSQQRQAWFTTYLKTIRMGGFASPVAMNSNGYGDGGGQNCDDELYS